MKISLCSSARFFDKLQGIKERLESFGFDVLLPSMVDYHNLEETALAKIQFNLIRAHFEKINDSDAILVVNYDKGDVRNYIGGSVLLEMGKAFDCKIPIFVLNPVPEVSYREEIIALQPMILNGDLDKIKEILKI